MSKNFSKSISQAYFGRIPAQHGLLSGQLGQFFVKVSREAVFAGPATLGDTSTSGGTSILPKLYHHKLPYTEQLGQVVIDAPNFWAAASLIRTPRLSPGVATFQRQRAATTPGAATHGALAQFVR